MTIRFATAFDVVVIHKFINQLENTQFDLSTFRKIFKSNLANKSNIYLIVQTNKIPVGFLSCHIQGLLHHNSYVAEIQELFVVKEYRGVGVGRKLLNYLMKELKKRNVHQLEASSNRKRRKAHQFYTSQQFKWTSKKFVLKF